MENTTESEKKKKYKIITVPQKNARVIQEGGLKFSNVKPITVIQQGNFALSSSRSKNKSTNSPNKNDKEENSNKNNLKKTPQSKSIPKKRVISYQEYKKRIQKTLNENKKIEKSPTPEQTKLSLTNVIQEKEKPKTLYEQYNNLSRDRSVDLRGKEVFTPSQNQTVVAAKGPVITRLTRTLSKPFLEVHRQSSAKKEDVSTGKYVTEKIQENKKDNIDSLVQKISKMNQNPENKSKTTGSISLNTLIRQVNQEVRFPPNTNKNASMNNGRKQVVKFKNKEDYKNHIFGHKKNHTMYNIDKGEKLIEKIDEARIRSGSSYNNQIPINVRNASIPKKVQNEKGFSRSSQQDYNAKNQVYNYVNTNNQNTKTSETGNLKKNETSQVKIYSNNGQGNTFYANSYKTNSKRKVEQISTDRLSYQRRGWKTVMKSPGTLKQSNSVTKLSANETGNNLKSNSVYKTTKNNYSMNINNAKFDNLKNTLGNGNITTTIRRYTVNPPPKSCLLYTSPSPRDLSTSRMPSSA